MLPRVTTSAAATDGGTRRARPRRKRAAASTATPWVGVFWMVAAFAAPPAYFVHGWCRMMMGAVGVRLDADGRCVIAGVLASLALVGLPVALPRLWIDEKRWPGTRWLGGVALGALAGCFVSEIFMLSDEAAFMDEVRVRGIDRPYDRPRAEPWTNAGLVWIPGEGAHATD